MILLSWRSGRFGKAAWRLSPGPPGCGSGGLGSSPAYKARHWGSSRKPWAPGGLSQIWSSCCTCLDLPEVHWLADQLVVLWQLLPGWQLDENLAELSPTGAAGITSSVSGKMTWRFLLGEYYDDHDITMLPHASKRIKTVSKGNNSNSCCYLFTVLLVKEHKHTDLKPAQINTKK